MFFFLIVFVHSRIHEQMVYRLVRVGIVMMFETRREKKQKKKKRKNEEVEEEEVEEKEEKRLCGSMTFTDSMSICHF
jgi:hypothetical protein